MDAVGGARQAQAAVLAGVAAGVEHPIETVRIPYGRLAQTVLVERAGVAQFQDRVAAELLPADAFLGTRDAQALAASAVLAEIEEVEIRLDAHHVRIGHAVLVPAPVRPRLEHGPWLFAPGVGIRGASQPDAGPLPRAGLIPIPELVLMEERGAVGGDVRPFPGPPIGREDHTFLLPVSAVFRDREARAPRAAVEAGVEIQEGRGRERSQTG